MPINPPSDPVLRVFGVSAAIAQPVEGGQGIAFRAGDLALKPCDDPEHEEWLSGVLADVQEDGFRISRPVRSQEGKYVFGGWCAKQWISGSTQIEGRWAEAIAACDAFGRAVREVPFSPTLHRVENPYTQSRLALLEGVPPADPRLGPMGERLRKMLRPITVPRQLVHGDPSEGNLLFSPGRPIGIIDIAACWEPADYAVAMLVADGIAWSNAPAELLDTIRHRTQMDQLLARAVLFRLMVALIFNRPDGVASRARHYAPVMEAIAQ